MNVILMERVRNLGDLGEEVVVKGGYARNYLIPTGRAVRATADNRSVFEARRAELERVANEKLAQGKQRAEKIDGAAVTIAARAGDEGKLYGSVGTHEIADALSRLGTEVARSEVQMPDGAIRVTGEYELEVSLHSDVTVTVHVTVVAE